MNPPGLSARWIWCRGEERPRNFYLFVRKSFMMSGTARRAVIRLTADSRYRLSVNGHHIAHGPARCDRRWQCLDEWDITKQLRTGANVIAVLVHHYGEWTFSYMLGRGAFLAEVTVEQADGGAMTVSSDASWRVCPARAWERQLPRMSIQLGFPEVYDARAETEGWQEPGYDDSQWEAATVLGPAGMEPWPRLEARDIPAMREVPVFPARVIDSGEIGIARTGHYIDLLRVVWNSSHAVGYLATFVWSAAESEVLIHAGSQEALRIWVNGELVISHLVTRDPAPDQDRASVRLRRGWNAILAKIVQGDGQWHFYFRFEGKESDGLVYADSPLEHPEEADGRSPWRLIGPFPSESVPHGFDASYPPEAELDFGGAYPGKNGEEIRWISAGVSREANITSVIMSREERFSGRGRPIDHPGGLVAPGPPAIFLPGSERGRYAVLDFGREVTGYPVLEVDGARGGEIIDLGYSEVLQTPAGEVVSPASGNVGIVNPDRAGVHHADRYICKPGRQRFQTFDKRAFRYLQLDVRNLTHPLAVGPVSAMLSTYPVEERGLFTCSDPLLDRIWEVGRWTVKLNMEDAYTDCPWRERGQWWGDVRVQALVNYYAFGDLALVRRGLRQVAQSQNEEGFTMGIYPTDWSDGILPTFTMLWIVSLQDYYLFSGDRDLVRELFPAVERSVACVERYRGERDLLRDVPYWLFVDWAKVETAGESASVNALYHGALRSAAELADVVAGDRSGDRYRALAARLRAALEQHLWSEEKGCFLESWKEGRTSSGISEQANCWAVAFGAAPEGRAEAMLDALFERRYATTLVGTPYFGFYVLRALACAGRHREALAYIRKQWGAMLDWGATTWWEQWEPKASFCHGWSAGPTHFLQAEILGVKPARPGWEELLIEPHTGDLTHAAGTVPTSRGPVSVAWRIENGFTLAVDTPAPTRVTFPLLTGEVATVTTADGRVPESARQGSADGRTMTIVLANPGRYTIQTTRRTL